MPEENEVEETESKPSTSRKITATLITLAVTVVIGMASTKFTEEINERIRAQITKTNE